MSVLRIQSAASQAAQAFLILSMAALAAWLAGGAAGALIGLIDGPGGAAMGLFLGLAALPFWLIGLYAVGGPLWLALHLSGRRDARTAMIFGALGGAIGAPAVLIFMSGFASGSADSALLLLAPPAAAAGALAGYIGWLLSYGDARR